MHFLTPRSTCGFKKCRRYRVVAINSTRTQKLTLFYTQSYENPGFSHELRSMLLGHQNPFGFSIEILVEEIKCPGCSAINGVNVRCCPKFDRVSKNASVVAHFSREDVCRLLFPKQGEEGVLENTRQQ